MNDVIYYPVVAVELRLRLDRTLHGLNSLYHSAGYGQQKTPIGGTAAAKFPMLFSGMVEDDLSCVLYLSPTDVTWELPEHRKSGTWTCKIPWRDLPVDPRIFSAIGIAIYADTVPENTATDPTSTSPRIALSNRRPRNGELPVPSEDNLILVGVTDMIKEAHNEQESMLSFTGRDIRSILIDSKFPPDLIAEIDMSKPLDEVIAFILSTHPRAKDMVAPAPIDNSKVATLDVTRSNGIAVPVTVDSTSGDLVAATVGSFLRVAASDWPSVGGRPQLPAPVSADAPVQRHRRTATAQNKKSSTKWASTKTRASSPSNSETSYWDMITQCCYLVGSIPVFYGPYLFIRNAAVMYQTARNANGTDIPTSFASGQSRWVDIDGVKQRVNLPTLLYGRNLTSYEISRKLQGKHALVVKVVCVDNSSSEKGTGKMLEAQWPPTALRSGDSPSGRGSEEGFVRVPVHGLRDIRQLQTVAKAIYEETMRSEVSGSFETFDLATLGGDNSDPDLLRLRPGHAIVVDVAGSRYEGLPPYIAELVRDASISDDAAADQIVKLLWPNALTEYHSLYGNKAVAYDSYTGIAQLAKFIVAAQRGKIVELQRTFYVTTIRVNYSAENGLRVSCDFTNYIEAQVNAAVVKAGPPPAEDAGNPYKDNLNTGVA